MPTIVFHLPCINVLSNGWRILLGSSTPIHRLVTADPQVWGYDGVECISGKVWEGDFLKMSDFGLKPIQAVGSQDSS
jgi:hypothetical protein